MEQVKVRAYSPGKYPILVVEASGRLMTAYHETNYDLNRTKPVGEDWLLENAVGRHGFVAVDPPEEMSPASLPDYARRLIRDPDAPGAEA